MNELFREVDAAILSAQDHARRLQQGKLPPEQATIVQGLVNAMAQVQTASTRVHDEHAKMESKWASTRPELT